MYLGTEMQQNACTFPFFDLSTEHGQPRSAVNCLLVSGRNSVKPQKSDMDWNPMVAH